MLRRSLVGMLLVVLGSASLGWAQAPAERDPRVAAVAPFVNGKTVLVMHLNLRNIDLPTAADRLTALAPEEAQEQLAQAKAGAKMIDFARKAMVDAGGPDIYVVVDATKPGEQPMSYLLIPVEEGKDPQEVAKTLSGMPGVDKEPIIHNNYVVFGDDGTAEYLKGITASDASRFEHAFKFTGQTDFQVVIAPTPEMLDQAKANAPPGQITPEQEELGKALRGFVFTANLPPKPALALFVLMKDEASAKKVSELVDEGLASEQGQQIKAHPLGAKAVDLLTPVQDGDKLRVVLTAQNGGIDKLTEIIKEGAALAMEAFQNGALPLPGGFGPDGLPPGSDPFGAPPGGDSIGSPGKDFDQ